MKTHIKHRFDNKTQLTLTEYGSGQFDVTYLTQEGHDEDGREMWFANNSDNYTSFSEALKGFNIRRESKHPFRSVKKWPSPTTPT